MISFFPCEEINMFEKREKKLYVESNFNCYYLV